MQTSSVDGFRAARRSGPVFSQRPTHQNRQVNSRQGVNSVMVRDFGMQPQFDMRRTNYSSRSYNSGLVGAQARVDSLRDSNFQHTKAQISRPHSGIFSRYFGNSKKGQLFSYGLALLVFTAGALISLQGLTLNRQVKQQLGPPDVSAQATGSEANSVVAVNDPEMPSEEPVTSDQVRQYTVAPEDPRYLTIPKIKVNSRIKPVGLEKDGAIAVPKNIYDVGWFTGSSRPGTGGAVVMDAHVSGPANHGVFYDLKKLSPGDIVTVEKGSGEKINYRVVALETFDKNNVDMQKVVRSIESDREGLNLITCSGKYLPNEKTYEKRLVVYTVAE